MDTKPSLSMAPSLEQTISPKMIAFYELLAMTSAELDDAIEQQVNLNPALEVTTEGECPRCGAIRSGAACRECGHEPMREYAGGSLSALYVPPGGSAFDSDYAPTDPTAALAAPATLHDHLRWALRANVPRGDWPAASALLDNLDDDGYLQAGLEDLAETEGLDPESLERALLALQQLEPVGVGARDLRECLALQLRHLAGLGVDQDLARQMVWDHWDAFSRRQFDRIAKKLNVSLAEVQSTADFIREHLTPYPGRHWRAPWDTPDPGQAPPVRPDVIYERVAEADGVRYEAHVPQSPWMLLRISRIYSRLSKQIESDPRSVDPADRSHVLEQAAKAREFIDNLNRRRHTLKRIADSVAEHQVDFLERGPAHLKPLTRLGVARELGIHESTVGRAIGGKWALLPTRETISFETFFDVGHPAREALRQIISREDPSRPFTDAELAAQMAQAGVPVARRTIAKYRRELKIPSARQRRRFD